METSRMKLKRKDRRQVYILPDPRSCVLLCAQAIVKRKRLSLVSHRAELSWLTLMAQGTKSNAMSCGQCHRKGTIGKLGAD